MSHEAVIANDAHIVSRAQLIIVLLAYVASLGVFYGTMQAGQTELRRSLDSIDRQVGDMGNAVNRLAGANERLDEHLKSVDHRLDVLEKDKPIESYRRN